MRKNCLRPNGVCGFWFFFYKTRPPRWQPMLNESSTKLKFLKTSVRVDILCCWHCTFTVHNNILFFNYIPIDCVQHLSCESEVPGVRQIFGQVCKEKKNKYLLKPETVYKKKEKKKIRISTDVKSCGDLLTSLVMFVRHNLLWIYSVLLFTR